MMSETPKTAAHKTAERIVELEAELEADGRAAVDGSDLEAALGVLRHWIEGVAAVVASPALGRVTLVHADGNASSIASPELAFLLSGPARAKPAE